MYDDSWADEPDSITSLRETMSVPIGLLPPQNLTMRSWCKQGLQLWVIAVGQMSQIQRSVLCLSHFELSNNKS